MGAGNWTWVLYKSNNCWAFSLQPPFPNCIQHLKSNQKQLLRRIKWDGTLPNLLHKSSIISTSKQNHRFISLNNTVTKILKKILANLIQDHIQKTIFMTHPIRKNNVGEITIFALKLYYRVIVIKIACLWPKKVDMYTNWTE